MITKMRKMGVKGFSLVELMVVVAIIGILAAVAIPNFQRFQRKARQSEANAQLGGIHQAETAFHGQWENYLSALDTIGFVPQGQLRYVTGFGNMSAVTWSNAQPGDYTGSVPTTNSNSANVCAAFPMACTDISAIGAPTGFVLPAGGLGVNATFTIASEGNIGGAMTDQWTMTQAKVLMNVQDGTQ